MRRGRGVGLVAVLGAAVMAPMFPSPSVALADPPSAASGPVEVSQAVHHDVSPALRNIPPATRGGAPHDHQLKPTGAAKPGGGGGGGSTDPVRQTAGSGAFPATQGLSFAGVGNGDYGFTPDAAPPDTNGAVGATQYVQWVNESFAVFAKTTGALVHGPVTGNTLWAGFGGACETNNDGDPIVQYDKAANRWIFTQFSVSSTPYLQCVAVSTTSDATGTYNRYAFQMNQFPDYPKLGVWPDGYYTSYNMYNGNSFNGAKVCAWDRTAMLAGGVATQECFQLASSFGSLLPSDLDGSTAPPAGSPAYFVNFGTNILNVWRFHADFTTPASASLSAPTALSVPSFQQACGGLSCVPQPGTRQKLDSLGDRVMYRLAYRNLGTTESMTVNHSVNPGDGTAGVRWYQLSGSGGTWSVTQKSTYAPTDGRYRWMGSMAMDKVGDILVGYSESGTQTRPSIAVAGQTAGSVGLSSEVVIKTGAGSQLQNLNRWGDYSAMTVDPSDDCTFWYTNEYLKASGTFNWSTWIASFKFANCH